MNETIVNTQFIDNRARVAAAWGCSINSRGFDDGTGLRGPRDATFRNVEWRGENRVGPWQVNFPTH
jgi:hypothetical protein